MQRRCLWCKMLLLPIRRNGKDTGLVYCPDCDKIDRMCQN